MNNHETARKLLASSRYYRQRMEDALAREFWNTAVRHAQEVVELGMKGVLAYLSVTYPKVHDPSAAFLQILAQHQITLADAEAKDVREMSAVLAERRMPAFYFEYDESSTGAHFAVSGARRVHDLCLRILVDLGWREEDAD